MEFLLKRREGEEIEIKETYLFYPELYDELLLPYQRKHETISRFFTRYCAFTEKHPSFWVNFKYPEAAKAHLFILQLRRIWWRRHLEQVTSKRTTLRTITLRTIRELLCIFLPSLRKYHECVRKLPEYYKISEWEGNRRKYQIEEKILWPWDQGIYDSRIPEGPRYGRLENYIDRSRKHHKISRCAKNTVPKDSEI